MQDNTEIKLDLKERYVAYVDVMGFKDLVNSDKVENLEMYFSKIMEVLEKINKDKEKIDSFLISDSIILIADETVEGLKQLLTAIKRIQFGLLWKKILIRGAVSFGQVYYDKEKNIIVGKGFIRAYLLEQDAVYPRVIIDPYIIGKIGKDKTGFLIKINGTNEYDFEKRFIYQKSKFSQIKDDGIFVDYANWSIRQSTISGLQSVYEKIVENLYAEQKLYSKYIWLRDYFIECLKLTKSVILLKYDNDEEYDASYYENYDKDYIEELEEWIEKFERL